MSHQRTTKKRPAAAVKPRRPLSCFNLFYRYKRTLVLDAHHSGTASDDVAIERIIREVPGTEESPTTHLASLSEAERNVLRRAKTKIRSVLEHNLLPNISTHLRSHRKASDGLSMTFVEMGKLMTESWKTVDPFAKDVFCELASEGKLVYRQLMDEYHAASKTLPPGGGKKPTFRYKPSMKSPPVLHEPIVSPSIVPSLVHVPSSRMASSPHDNVSFTSASVEVDEKLPFLRTALFEEDEAQLRTDVARWRMSLSSSMHVSRVAPAPVPVTFPFFTTDYSPSSSNHHIQESSGCEMSDSILDMEALQQQGISAGDFMTFVTKLAE
jgi:hypothetical protein